MILVVRNGAQRGVSNHGNKSNICHPSRRAGALLRMSPL
jgi:hypothetical protein